MARKRGSRRRPHRDATRRGPGRREHPAAGIEDDPLLHGLRQSLRSSPVDFGALVASIHYITTDETMDALGGPPDGMEGPPMSLNDLVESIIDIDISETTHALHVLAALIDDELLAARIRRALTTRRQPVHPAVERFGEVEVRDAYLITEPTGRSDEILLAARWPDGTEATLILLISHIVGGAITDFLVSQEGNAATAEHIRTSSADHGLKMTAIDPADARATLRRAIDAWVEEMPDIEEGMWPDALPFLEFVLERMPTGGEVVGSGGRWTDDWAGDSELDDSTELAHDFLVSDEIGEPDDDLDHEIAHAIARFATLFLDDPLHWTAQSAELAMTTALPIQLTGDEDEFARTPTLVRAFIRYAHARRGLSAELTLAVTREVDRHEEVFHLLRDDPEVVGARIDLMAAAAEELRMDGLGWGMRSLVDRLGSVEAVDALTDEPLPNEDLDLSGVPEDVWDRVRATAELTDRVADELIGDREIRTACRRLLTIAAREDPRIFRRRSRDDTAAAAVAWIVGRANGVFGWGGRVQIKELMDALGLPPGSPSQRAQPFLDALGVDRYQRLDGQSLGTPDLLTSATRRRLIEMRDRLRASTSRTDRRAMAIGSGSQETEDIMEQFTAEQMDRAVGVLIGQACGDALGVPYEFGAPPSDGRPVMKGGGLGNYAPGEWSDDTQMALCIAEVAATGADLTETSALDDIAVKFEQWYATGPADIGIQTRQVLALAARLDGRPSSRLTEASRQVHDQTGRSAGNGALMRTSPVALAYLNDPDRAIEAARTIAALTHHDPLAGDSCVLWTDLIRRAVLDGELARADLELIPAGRRDYWAGLVADAEQQSPRTFVPNGDTMRAFQAAYASVRTASRRTDSAGLVEEGLVEAILVGNDTDTVAAIAGGLLGGLAGLRSIPEQWVRDINGWPGYRADGLVQMAHAIVGQSPGTD